MKRANREQTTFSFSSFFIFKFYQIFSPNSGIFSMKWRKSLLETWQQWSKFHGAQESKLLGLYRMARHRKAWAAGTCLGLEPRPHFSLFSQSTVEVRKDIYAHQLKGIVSRDFRRLQMILMDIIGVPVVPLEVSLFLNFRFHIVF